MFLIQSKDVVPRRKTTLVIIGLSYPLHFKCVLRWPCYRRRLRMENVLQRESPQRSIQSGRRPEPAAQRGRPHHHDQQGALCELAVCIRKVITVPLEIRLRWIWLIHIHCFHHREPAPLVLMNLVTQSTRTVGPWAALTGPCSTRSKKSAPWQTASTCRGTSSWVKKAFDKCS